MLYQTLVRRAEEITEKAVFIASSQPEREQEVAVKREQWLEMLGLSPLPERTALSVEQTGILERGDLVIEKLNFQIFPNCRIAANLYRPKHITTPLPAVVYVCGHAQRSKFHYQEHPRWFGTHGYVALIIDAIQIGENTGFHHGTYSRNWWHWISQGYSPGAAEVWAAMRAADYLQSRDDVDGEKLGITGNSGGGTVSWFTGAADPRFKIVVPSCQTGNLFQHIYDRTIDGHCDCSFWMNTYGWDLRDLVSLICPRPLLIAAATGDILFRPYAFRDVFHSGEKLYQAHGGKENICLVEADTPHGYSPKTRTTIFRWFNQHLKGIQTLEVDDVSEERETDEDLAVYPEAKPPADDNLKNVDTFMIPYKKIPPPEEIDWASYRVPTLENLKKLSFRQIPDSFTFAQPPNVRQQGKSKQWQYQSIEFESEPGMGIRIQLALPVDATSPVPILVGAVSADARTTFCAQGAGISGINPKVAGFAAVEVRGTGNTSIGPGLSWTCRRAYPLVGQTLWERRTFDLLAAIQVLQEHPGVSTVAVFGSEENAAVALYAALLNENITEVVFRNPVDTHWNCGPEFLHVLKTGDLPQNAALLAPRHLTCVDGMLKAYQWTKQAHPTTVRTLPDLTTGVPKHKPATTHRF